MPEEMRFARSCVSEVASRRSGEGQHAIGHLKKRTQFVAACCSDALHVIHVIPAFAGKTERCPKDDVKKRTQFVKAACCAASYVMHVIPAQAGIQAFTAWLVEGGFWIHAFAGMTEEDAGKAI
jgi:hypothetical protein